MYCVTKGNISISSLLFCFRRAAFLLWVLLLIAVFLSKLCRQRLSNSRFLKSEILPLRSLFVGFSRLLVCQIHFDNWWVVRGENVYTGRFLFKMRLYVNDSFFSVFVECCALVLTTGSKKIVSVSDISAVNFIASRAIGWSKFNYLFREFEEIYYV